MEKASIPMRPSTDFSDTLAAPLASEIDELAERSESLEQRIASLNDSYETLKKREVELSEWRWVLREAGGFFDRVSIDHEIIGGRMETDIEILGPHPHRRYPSILR
jgi:V-type H+-transporting ATPase subunit a